MSPLTDNDRELIRLIAQEVASEMREHTRADIQLAVADHQKGCPVAAKLEIKLWKLTCLLVASGAIGGGAVRLLF